LQALVLSDEKRTNVETPAFHSSFSRQQNELFAEALTMSIDSDLQTRLQDLAEGLLQPGAVVGLLRGAERVCSAQVTWKATACVRCHWTQFSEFRR
jgi:hypothetical protein